MSDDLHKRTTSYAKTLDLDEQKKALESALKEEFDRAKTAQEPAREQDNTRQAEKTAKPAHAPKPEPHLRPEGEIRRAVDKQIDNEKLDKERQRAKELSDAWKERVEKHKGMDHDNDLHKERHHRR